MKILYAFVFICLIVTLGCGGGESNETEKKGEAEKEVKTAKADGPNGEKIFRTYCITCHGIDGKLGLNGAKDLSVSEVTLEDRIAQVTNGKGLMTPFEGILSEEQIKAVVDYTFTFKE